MGYHTFWHTGSHLALLSGVVGRPEGGSTHAYENLMLASLGLARDLGCQRADFGLGVNAVNIGLLGRSPNRLHLISRVGALRAGLRVLRAHSRLPSRPLETVTGPFPDDP